MFEARTVKCCICSDKRPRADEYQETKYVDGKGAVTMTVTRRKHYCGLCNDSTPIKKLRWVRDCLR
jgi:hypothetical protein